VGNDSRFFVLFFILTLALSIAQGANLTLDMGDGTTQSFQNVEVSGAVQDASGNLSFNVAMTPGGEAYPIEASRIQELSFITNGKGQYFDLTVMIQGTPQSFPSSQVMGFNQQGLFAIAPGSINQEQLPVNSIVRMIPGSAPVPTPVPLAPPPDDETEFMTNEMPEDFSDNPFADFEDQNTSLINGADHLVSQEAVDAATGGPSVDELSEDDFYVDTTGGTTSGEDTAIAVIMGVFTSIGIFIYIYLFALLISNIWFIIYAFKEAQIVDGIIMLITFFFCNIYPIFYALLRYDGPWRLFFQILWGLWILTAIVLAFIIVSALAAVGASV